MSHDDLCLGFWCVKQFGDCLIFFTAKVFCVGNDCYCLLSHAGWIFCTVSVGEGEEWAGQDIIIICLGAIQRVLRKVAVKSLSIWYWI